MPPLKSLVSTFIQNNPAQGDPNEGFYTAEDLSYEDAVDAFNFQMMQLKLSIVESDEVKNKHKSIRAEMKKRESLDNFNSQINALKKTWKVGQFTRDYHLRGLAYYFDFAKRIFGESDPKLYQALEVQWKNLRKEAITADAHSLVRATYDYCISEGEKTEINDIDLGGVLETNNISLETMLGIIFETLIELDVDRSQFLINKAMRDELVKLIKSKEKEGRYVWHDEGGIKAIRPRRDFTNKDKIWSAVHLLRFLESDLEDQTKTEQDHPVELDQQLGKLEELKGRWLKKSPFRRNYVVRNSFTEIVYSNRQKLTDDEYKKLVDRYMEVKKEAYIADAQAITNAVYEWCTEIKARPEEMTDLRGLLIEIADGLREFDVNHSQFQLEVGKMRQLNQIISSAAKKDTNIVWEEELEPVQMKIVGPPKDEYRKIWDIIYLFKFLQSGDLATNWET